MKIISKFHDYYDCMIPYDEDNKYVFLRESKQFLLDRKKYNSDYSWYMKTDNRDVFFNFLDVEKLDRYSIPFKYKNKMANGETFVIGFCGEIYNGIKITTNLSKQIPTVDFLYEDSMYKIIDDYRSLYDKIQHMSWRIPTSSTRFKEIKKNKNLKKIFLENRVPYFILFNKDSKTHCKLNFCLKDYKFYKLFECTQTYQEIRMFIENNLASDTEVNVPTGDDVVLAESKGYDKFSFRKDKKEK